MGVLDIILGIILIICSVAITFFMVIAKHAAQGGLTGETTSRTTNSHAPKGKDPVRYIVIGACVICCILLFLAERGIVL